MIGAQKKWNSIIGEQKLVVGTKKIRSGMPHQKIVAESRDLSICLEMSRQISRLLDLIRRLLTFSNSKNSFLKKLNHLRLRALDSERDVSSGLWDLSRILWDHSLLECRSCISISWDRDVSSSTRDLSRLCQNTVSLCQTTRELSKKIRDISKNLDIIFVQCLTFQTWVS